MAKFPQLPYELREKIWLDTIEPRLVGLIPCLVSKGRWSVKSTARPPVALHVNAESRRIVSKYYKILETHSVENHKSTIYEGDFVALDVSPHILFNFDIDTLHFADTAPPDKPLVEPDVRMKPKIPTNALDLLILKESFDAFQGPGFRLMLNAYDRLQDWPYLLEAKDVSYYDSIRSVDPTLLNWTHIHYVRLDFNIFLSDLAIWWGNMHPFVLWMQQAAAHVEAPDDLIRSYDLVMVNGRGDKRKLQKTFRLALRPEKEADAAYQSLSPIEQLEQYGAVVFEEVLPTPEGKAILFEVVDPLIGGEAIAKWKQFSIDQRARPSPHLTVLPRTTPFGADLKVLWHMAKGRRGLAHGAMSPVHGLCLADYGRDGGFRGRT